MKTAPEFIRAGKAYHALLNSIRNEDGDRAWAELDRRKSAWVEAAARLWEEMSAAPNDNQMAVREFVERWLKEIPARQNPCDHIYYDSEGFMVADTTPKD